MIHSLGRIYCPYFKGYSQHNKEGTKDIFVSISTLEMILDLSKRTLSCVMNGEETKTYNAFENIVKGSDIKYSLSVVMIANKGDEISILSFEVI